MKFSNRAAVAAVVVSVTTFVGMSGVPAATSKKRPATTKKPAATKPKPAPTKRVATTLVAPADALGRRFCGDPGVQVRVPVTTMSCQSPLPDAELGTKEALLAAYEKYWITNAAVAKEPRLAKSQLPRILIAAALTEAFAYADAFETDSYWDGTRADLKQLNTRVRTLDKSFAVIEDCVEEGGVTRSHKTGKAYAGAEKVDRFAYQFKFVNVSGTWLINDRGVLDDASIEGNSTCTATDP
jgi:hypothetical protein